VVSRLREPQCQSRRAPEAPPNGEPGETADGEQGSAEETEFIPLPEAPPLAQPLAGAGEGRPKPRPPRGSAAPVRGEVFRRSSEQPGAPERTERAAARRHKSGADIRPVSQEEMLTGARPGEANPSDGGGAIGPNRPTSPDADFDATHKRVKEQQKRNIAAKSAAEAAKLASVVLREAEMIDELGSTVGRASTVLKDGNLLTAEQVEVFLSPKPDSTPVADTELGGGRQIDVALDAAQAEEILALEVGAVRPAQDFQGVTAFGHSVELLH
jgi:hypothetical protein